MKRLTFSFFVLLFVVQVWAQKADYSKMSSLVRSVTIRHGDGRHLSPSITDTPKARICAFVRIRQKADSILAANGCNQLACFGDTYIADIPLSRLGILSFEPNVKRIEANRSCSALMDSTALHINALPVYTGKNLPQAFTGKGVIMGIQDIGFDLTHPNFYDSTTTKYRIKRLWDQLSLETQGSRFYVGNDYTSKRELLRYAHSRDGESQTHGTHTLGIAAGSGYNSKYRGIAYESDICLVANGAGDNYELIDSVSRYKYTSATDLMGFMYIFDYAQSTAQPCVISFSEGGNESINGDDSLYYATLDKLVGPGRIIVSSAGNNAQLNRYFHKTAEEESKGAFITAWDKNIYFSLIGNDDMFLRFKFYHDNQVDTLLIPTKNILSMKDSLFEDTITIADFQYKFMIQAYHSHFGVNKTAYDVLINSNKNFWDNTDLSFEAVGKGVDTEYFQYVGFLTTNAKDATLNAGDNTHCINSPSSAPSVISVGATSYRTGIINYLGEYKSFIQGTNGERAYYSSVGPTLDGRIKPDVMAPGTNIISSYSSYYLEHNPTAGDIAWDVEHFQFGGRTYAWNTNSGTSMSSPVVGGVIALWLQAKPTLTPEDIKGIFSRTCSHHDPSLSYPNNDYGYGEVDAYWGLLDILGINGIKGLSSSQPTAVNIYPTSDGDVRIDFKSAPVKTFTVNIYSTSGALLKSERHTDLSISYTISLNGLPHGIYAVQVNGYNMSTTGSSLIRR